MTCECESCLLDSGRVTTVDMEIGSAVRDIGLGFASCLSVPRRTIDHWWSPVRIPSVIVHQGRRLRTHLDDRFSRSSLGDILVDDLDNLRGDVGDGFHDDCEERRTSMMKRSLAT
jgi:hypothetical protein